MANLCSRCERFDCAPRRRLCVRCNRIAMSERNAKDREVRAERAAVRRLEPIEVPERLRRLLREHWEGGE